MGMAVDQLAREPIEDDVDRKGTLLLRHFGIKEHLQEQIAKFTGEFMPVAVVDGFENFVGFFQGIRFDGIESLFAIPRAAARGAEAIHDGDRSLETFPCAGHAATNVNDGEGSKQCGAIWRRKRAPTGADLPASYRHQVS